MVVNGKIRIALALAVVSVAVAAGGAFERRGVEKARSAGTELDRLQPELDRSLALMVEGIQERAKQHQNWLRQGSLGPENEETLKIGAALAQLVSIRFDSPDAFEQADRLQTVVSDAIARQLASGALSHELGKAIERLDMSAQLRRSEYFALVKRQHGLLKTPLIGRIGRERAVAYRVALTFPSERILLDAAL